MINKRIEIVDTPERITLRVNGVLIYNYHDTALLVIRQMYGENEIIKMMLRYELFLDMFIQQLREEGYFNE